MERFDLSSVRSQLTKLSLGQINPELFEDLFGIDNVQEVLEELAPAVEELITELLTEVAGAESEDDSERAAQLMLRELATTAFIAGRLTGGINAPGNTGVVIDITPDVALEFVRALLGGQAFRFSFEVKE